MKYESKRQSGQQKTIYQFSIGVEEMVCIAQVLNDARRNTPRTIDTATFRGRIKNIADEIADTLSAENIKIPRSYSHQITKTN